MKNTASMKLLLLVVSLASLMLSSQLASASASSEGSSSSREEEKESSHLRRRRTAAATEAAHNNEGVTEGVQVHQAVGDGRLRIVLQCQPHKLHEQCLKRLKEFEDGRLEIIHKLHEPQAWAASVGQSDEETMRALEEGNFFDIASDVVRKPMYIPESLRVEEDDDDGDDDRRNLQFWNSQSVPYGIDMVKARDVWEKYDVRGAGVKVCVLDTGILGSHADFSGGNLSGYSGREAVTPWDRDGNGHGTHVSGTIAASDNGRGVVGVAPDAQIYTVRIFDDRGDFYGSDVVAAAEACRDAGAKIISMSLGGPSYMGAEKRIFEALFEQGILAIAAAGNDGDDDYSFPASYARVMSVAAVNSNRNHASFSQYNDRVDIAAPGVNVRSTWNNGRYSSISGTSMATPHVSGVAALMKAHKPSATPAELYDALIGTAENPNTSGRDDRYGHGIVNALSAMDALGGNDGSSNPGSPTQAPVQNDCQAGQINFEFKLRTDDYGYETSWELRDVITGTAVESRAEGTYNNNVEDDLRLCLDGTKCYALTIEDAYGDGMCCGQNNPGFELIADGQVIQSNEEFSKAVTISGIGNCPTQTAPTDPTDAPGGGSIITPTNPPAPSPTSPPVAAPTQTTVPSPTSPPSQECCFLFWCWSC